MYVTAEVIHTSTCVMRHELKQYRGDFEFIALSEDVYFKVEQAVHTAPLCLELIEIPFVIFT